MRLIDADALDEAMYHEAFETDTDMQMWDGGCWIRYKMFENKIKEAPTIDGLKVVLEKITRAIVQTQDVINDNICISGRFRLDTLMKELKGIRAMIEKYDQHGSRTEKEAPDEH